MAAETGRGGSRGLTGLSGTARGRRGRRRVPRGVSAKPSDVGAGERSRRPRRLSFAARRSVGRRWTHLHVFRLARRFLRLYTRRKVPRACSGKEEEGGVRCGSPSNWHFSGQRSGHSNQRRLPTMAPQNHQDTSLRNPRVPAAACRARPKTTQPQGHAAKDPSAPAKSHAERAPRGRKPPRNRGASRPPPSSAAAPHVELPSEDMSGTELSPRNLPVGVAIAIGPSRKPGSSSSRDCERRSLPTSTQRWCKSAVAALISGQEPVAPSKSSSPPLQEPQSKSVPAAV